MVQLIIVVIAITLGAALGAVGLFYLSGPVMDAKDRTIALQYISQGAQIATAWKAWSKANGSFALTQRNWLQSGSTDLVPQYLSALPTSPLPPNISRLTWLPTYLNQFQWSGSGTGLQSTNSNVNGLIAWLDTTKAGHRICQQIVNLSQGSNASIPMVNAFANITPRNNAFFDCFIYDNNGNGVADVGTDDPNVVYRVF